MYSHHSQTKKLGRQLLYRYSLRAVRVHENSVNMIS